jgi:hypothetical protein
MAYETPKARDLLGEAGYPNGFDAGEMIGTVSVRRREGLRHVIREHSLDSLADPALHVCA